MASVTAIRQKVRTDLLLFRYHATYTNAARVGPGLLPRLLCTLSGPTRRSVGGLYFV